MSEITVGTGLGKSTGIASGEIRGKTDLTRESQKVGAGRKEMLLAAAGWAAFLAALLYFTQAYVGFERWFWLDETITAMIARDPSPVHAFGSIVDGVDSNLPGLYVMLWVLKVVGVPMTETALHAVSFAALWLMLVGLYGLLRLVFSRSATVLAILPLLLANVVMDQAFEIRFYIFWAAGSVWLAYGLARLRLARGRFSAWHVVVFFLTLFATCIHYFSLLTLGCMLICDWWADDRSRGEKWRARWPVALGMWPALLAPWLYFHQRQMLSGTWMWPATVHETATFLCTALMLDKVGILAGIFLAVWLLGRRVRFLKLQNVPIARLALLAGLGGLAILPLIIVAMSWLFQPMLVARYALPGLPALTILFALLFYRLPRVVLAACFALLLAGVTYKFSFVAPIVSNSLISMEGMGIDVATKAPPGPVLFEARQDLYPIALYLPSLQPRLFYLDFEANEESAETFPITANFSFFERDAQRGVVRHYPFIQSWPKSRLKEWDSFTLVHYGGPVYPINLRRIAARFPGWDIYSINEHLLWLHKHPVTETAKEDSGGGGR